MIIVYFKLGCTRLKIEAPTKELAVASFKEDFPDKEPEIIEL